VTDDPQPPADILVRARWVSPQDRAWVERSDQILKEYGVVCGTMTFKTYSRAKYQATKLRRLMDVLGVHPAYQLITHTERHENGWRWYLEWKGNHNGRAEPRHASAV
jgi:hypothetical protein